MTTRDDLYVLAADHRWQWHEWCAANGRSRDVIPELKRIAVDGFLTAFDRSRDVQTHGAMLLDEQYSSDAIARLRARGVPVAAPVERPGVFPLEWAAEPFWSALTGSMAKVLVRYRPDYAPARVRAERDRLRELSDWCAGHGQPWMLEVVVPAGEGEAEERFEREGRPAALAQYIRDAYDAGIRPDYWKMEGTTSADGARRIDEAVRRAAGTGFLVLGKAAPLATIASWFETTRAMQSAAGFAIGRSIYWDPAAGWALGQLPREEAVESVAETYLATIELWNRVPSATRS